LQKHARQDGQMTDGLFDRDFTIIPVHAFVVPFPRRSAAEAFEAKHWHHSIASRSMGAAQLGHGSDVTDFGIGFLLTPALRQASSISAPKRGKNTCVAVPAD
jgi:hypothetical protein